MKYTVFEGCFLNKYFLAEVLLYPGKTGVGHRGSVNCVISDFFLKIPFHRTLPLSEAGAQTEPDL
jgi:hypothetical protein